MQLTYAQEKACPCPQPGYLNRNGWCPNGDCPPHPNPSPTDVSHLIVHHAASTNFSANWPAIVRSIWDFHVNGNGWSDIGYNWLVDPEGIIYEGRGDGIQGAHFCGANGNTSGFCLLGNFTNTLPSGAALSSLTEMLAWNACHKNIDPIGSEFHPSSNKIIPNIAGHQDGCSTECPGAMFYPTLSNFRQSVQDQIDFACANLPAPTNLTGFTASSTSIQLNWNDNAFDETSYLLERANWTNQDYIQIANLEADTDAYLDENLETNSIYFYRVRATNEIDTTAYSNELGISTLVQNSNELEKLNIKVFPSPADNQVNIHLGSAQNSIDKISIVNVLGQTKWSLNDLTADSYTIPIDEWSKGIYYLHFYFSNKIIPLPIYIN